MSASEVPRVVCAATPAEVLLQERLQQMCNVPASHESTRNDGANKVPPTAASSSIENFGVGIGFGASLDLSASGELGVHQFGDDCESEDEAQRNCVDTSPRAVQPSRRQQDHSPKVQLQKRPQRQSMPKSSTETVRVGARSNISPRRVWPLNSLGSEWPQPGKHLAGGQSSARRKIVSKSTASAPIPVSATACNVGGASGQLCLSEHLTSLVAGGARSKRRRIARTSSQSQWTRSFRMNARPASAPSGKSKESGGFTIAQLGERLGIDPQRASFRRTDVSVSHDDALSSDDDISTAGAWSRRSPGSNSGLKEDLIHDRTPKPMATATTTITSAVEAYTPSPPPSSLPAWLRNDSSGKRHCGRSIVRGGKANSLSELLQRARSRSKQRVQDLEQSSREPGYSSEGTEGTGIFRSARSPWDRPSLCVRVCEARAKDGFLWELRCEVIAVEGTRDTASSNADCECNQDCITSAQLDSSEMWRLPPQRRICVFVQAPNILRGRGKSDTTTKGRALQGLGHLQSTNGEGVGDKIPALVDEVGSRRLRVHWPWFVLPGTLSQTGEIFVVCGSLVLIEPD